MPRLRREDSGGITEHRIDEAGRITLTADQRDSFPNGEINLILWLIDGCLRLCTTERLADLVRQVEEEWPDRRLQDLAFRQTVGSVRIVTIDDAGRIRVPYIYLEFLGLDGHAKKAWLVPLREGLYELWNPDTFREHVAQDLYKLAERNATHRGIAEAGQIRGAPMENGQGGNG
jgi:DNA-binding transcriptional regulator/RsmH inhibitor MraZ